MKISILIGLVVLAPISLVTAGVRFPGQCDTTKTSVVGPPGVYYVGACDSKKAPEQQETKKERMLAGTISNVLCNGVGCDDKKGESNAVKNYVALINPAAYSNTSKVGLSNKGLRQYLQDEHQKTPSCISSLAYRFYKNPAVYGRSGASDLGSSSQNGDIWKTASKYCGNQPDLCISLIGICGHDDNVENPKENYVSVCFEGKDVENIYAAVDKDCLKKQPQTISGTFSCPQKGSNLFRQGGIPGLEISSALRSQIAREQAPGIPEAKALATLPHKYYHLYGSSFLTCKMIQDGLAPNKAVEVERMTSLLYRAMRVCDMARKNMGNYSRVVERMKVASQPVADIDFSDDPVNIAADWNKNSVLVTQYLMGRIRAGDVKLLSSIGLVGDDVSDLNAQDKIVLNEKAKKYPGIVLAGYLTKVDHKKMSDKELQARLEATYGKDGAAIFLNTFKDLRSKLKWAGTGGRILGSLTGMDEMENLGEVAPCIQNALLNYTTEHEYQCKSFQNCGDAEKKLGTYHADFLQSDRLHQMGSAFAKKNCKGPGAPGGDLETRACAQLKIVQARESNPGQSTDGPEGGSPKSAGKIGK